MEGIALTVSNLISTGPYDLRQNPYAVALLEVVLGNGNASLVRVRNSYGKSAMYMRRPAANNFLTNLAGRPNPK